MRVRGSWSSLSFWTLLVLVLVLYCVRQTHSRTLLMLIVLNSYLVVSLSFVGLEMTCNNSYSLVLISSYICLLIVANSCD